MDILVYEKHGNKTSKNKNRYIYKYIKKSFKYKFIQLMAT